MPHVTHELPKLPFEYDALDGISEEVVRWHHDTHHKAYIDGRNGAQQRLETARKSKDFGTIRAIKEAESFNQAGQVLHNIYWSNLGGKGGKPTGELLVAIERDFGSFDAFEAEFRAVAGVSRGWALLVVDFTDGRLHTTLVDFHHENAWWNVAPILCLDMWEHSYYRQHGPKKDPYVDAFLKNVNWEDVKRRFEAARRAHELLSR